MSINSLSQDEHRIKVKPAPPVDKVKGNERRQRMMSEIDDREFRKKLNEEVGMDCFVRYV